MRQEFSRKVRAAAFARCGGFCESCPAKLFVGKFTYDHVIPDWMGGEPTLENCQVICSACDKLKTKSDQSDIAKSKRVRDKHTGAMVSKRPMAGSRRDWRKRKMDGTVVDRRTGKRIK